MAIKASDLYARIKKTDEDAAALKAYWESSLPHDICPPPPDFELKNAVRRLPLDYLVTGIEAYVQKVSGKEEEEAQGKDMRLPVNGKNALNYVCGTAWKIKEQESSDQTFPPTARRHRNASRDPDAPQWDREAFHTTSPEERQRIMAEIIAKEKAQSQ